MSVLAPAGISNGLIVTIVVIAALVMGALSGLRRGLIVEVALTAGVVIALVLARAADGTARSALAGIMGHSHWLAATSYLVTFAIIWAAILILARGVRRIARLALLGPLDSLAGAALALIQTALVLAMLLALARHAPNRTVRAAVAHSSAAHVLLQSLPAIHPLLPHLALMP
ncbi:MAG TPA: CvpA family protein [Chloroflexota bacterium]|nr:CvpA family protein [Chloroflexota bacterium]